MEAVLQIPISDNIAFRMAGSVDREPKKEKDCCFKTPRNEQALFFYKGRSCVLELSEGRKIKSSITNIEENADSYRIHVKPENRSR